MHTSQNFFPTEREEMDKSNSIYENNDAELKKAQERITETNFQLFKKKKHLNQEINIINTLKNHFIFYNLSEAEIQNIKDCMYWTRVPANTVLFNFDDIGSCFFIIDKGSIELNSQGIMKKKILRPNDGFGELALLYNTQRRSEATAIQQTSMWVIDRIGFRKAVQQMIIRQYTQNKRCFESVNFFSNLTSDQKDVIASSLIRQKFYKGQSIIQEGDPGSTFYFIKQGTASVYKANKFQRKLTKGDSFGEQSLYYNTMRQFTIVADDEVICLILGRDTLNKIMGDNIYEVTFKNFIRVALEKNGVFSQIRRDTLQKVIQEMKINSYKAQEVIFKKGISGFQKIVVIIEGALKKAREGTIVATKGQVFGDQFLANKDKVHDDQIVMQNYGVLAEISEQDFQSAVGSQNFNDLISAKKLESYVAIERLSVKNTLKTNLREASFDQIIVKYLLSSKGQFGPLYLCQHQRQNYLLKLIDKEELEKHEVVEFAIQQAKVLSQISCPFVVTMGKKFQTSNFIYYLNEFVEGEDFYQTLKSIGLLSTEDAQFYTANIIIILEYFAELGIICRDIKPQNFMVDKEGYLKLINLPTAKMVKKEVNGSLKKTFTIIGTPHYMAPDIVIGKGYNNMVDLWSLGVCLYEFLCGVLPFGDSSESAYQIYEQIMQTQLKFPQFLHDKRAKKLIEQLLNHNPNQRHFGSFENLKKNIWFEKFNWKAILERNKKLMLPPAIPEVRQITSKSINKTLNQFLALQQKDMPKCSSDSRWANF